MDDGSAATPGTLPEESCAMMRIFYIASFVAAVALAAAVEAAESQVLVVCSPGSPGSTDEARAAMASFSNAVSAKAGESIAAVYEPSQRGRETPPAGRPRDRLAPVLPRAPAGARAARTPDGGAKRAPGARNLGPGREEGAHQESRRSRQLQDRLRKRSRRRSCAVWSRAHWESFRRAPRFLGIDGRPVVVAARGERRARRVCSTVPRRRPCRPCRSRRTSRSWGARSRCRPGCRDGRREGAAEDLGTDRAALVGLAWIALVQQRSKRCTSSGSSRSMNTRSVRRRPPLASVP